MISKLTGVLEMATDGRADVQCGDITYTLLVPGADQQQLASQIGQTVAFHTLHYLEGQGQGSNFLPRLIGFQSANDRAFFEVFTTVKGIGNRKALRALQLPFSRVADAINRKDTDLLKTLPEIGKRSAETIVAELHGKVEQFINFDSDTTSSATETPTTGIASQAIEVLTMLGEPKLQVMQLVDRAMSADPGIETTDALVTAVYRLKSLA